MILASLILMISAGLFMFYLETICQRVLRREFEYTYFTSVVNMNRLAFPTVRSEVEKLDSAGDYPGLRAALRGDYTALTYLLKHSNNSNLRVAPEERLLMAYFRAMMFFLTLCHFLKLSEKPAIIKLTSILQYFSNVIGLRMSELRLGNLTASDYLLRS
jgi:hypothetical protein